MTIATNDINRLMDMLRMRLPGAIDDAIALELFAAMNEFFQNSNAWTEDISLNVDPSLQSYDLTPTYGTINRLIYAINADDLPQSCAMQTPGTLDLQFAPSQAETWTVRVGLTVTDPTDRNGYPQFPAWFLNKYGNDILDGVLARMMSHPSKPYTNTAMAAYHAKRWQGSISQAKVEAQHKNVYRGQAWRFPVFARGRRRR